MGAITTHVLDTARGLPAVSVPVLLERRTGGGGWETLGAGETDGDGRLTTLLPTGHAPAPGTYRLTFDTDAPSRSGGGPPAFYPEVQITFAVADPAQHYHIPLLLSPFGYTTYRGS